MPAFGAEPAELPPRVAELAEEPDAVDWATLCGWVPGGGYCRQGECSLGCLFRPQREAEARRVARWRRLRRVSACR